MEVRFAKLHIPLGRSSRLQKGRAARECGQAPAGRSAARSWPSSDPQPLTPSGLRPSSLKHRSSPSSWTAFTLPGWVRLTLWLPARASQRHAALQPEACRQPAPARLARYRGGGRSRIPSFRNVAMDSRIADRFHRQEVCSGSAPHPR